MNEVQRAKIILKILNKIYPKIEVPLKSRNVFTLLISVLLSAQCTDVNVNNVTKNIYKNLYFSHSLFLFQALKQFQMGNPFYVCDVFQKLYSRSYFQGILM